VAQLQGKLQSHDKTGNGCLDKQEFNEFMNALGIFLAT